MRLFIFLVMGLSASAMAAQIQVENVRIWAAPDNTRVVFDIAKPVKHKLLLLATPPRLAIDIKNAALVKRIRQPVRSDKYLLGVRSAARGKHDLRVVLDLKKNITMRSFQLKPNRQYGHRLVIDLYDEGYKEEQVKIITKNDRKKRSKNVVIAIDAGHGGEDPGARGPSGVLEKKITLEIAKRLTRLINKEYGMKAVLIRQGDYFMRLRKRINKARQHRADLFVSIHADSFKDPSVRGSSVYILSNRGASSEAARWLAERENASDLVGGVKLDDKDDVLASVLLDLSQTASLEASIGVADRVLKSLKQLGKVHKKSVQSAGFAVLKSPDIPSILIETAYISNPAEERKLLNTNHQKKLAKAILLGLKGYFATNAPEGTLLASSTVKKHIILPGETLSSIARRYNVNMSALRASNQLQNDRLKPGQVLSIPTI